MAAATNGDIAEVATSNGSNESPYVKEIHKNIRNINKKLASTHKTDAVVAENPGVSLDELVEQKKINADQKASALKKPQLQAQLAQLEEQLQQYRKFESDSHDLLSKQKEELGSKHGEELARVKQEAHKEAAEAGKSELKNNLLLFSQFLRAAAAKRSEEENVDSEESKAFEGILLLVYGGDQTSVEAALKIIEGSDDKAPGIDGTPTSVSYGQVKKASIEHSPFQTEEAWVDSVAEAQAASAPAGSDPTLVNAGLTEQQDVLKSGATDAGTSQPLSTDAANAAADRWDSNVVSGGVESSTLDESYEVIPRPDEEVDTPAPSAADAPGAAELIDTSTPTASASWDDQVPAYAAPPVVKPAVPETDGFQEVAGRSRGGRGRGGPHRGDGEHGGRGRGRGRGGFGGRGRGDGEFRGGRGDGEFRGRGGRGRGPRGDGPRSESYRGDGHRGEGHRGDGHRGEGHRGDGPRGEGHRGDGPRGEGHRGDRHRGDGPRAHAPRGDAPRGDGPPQA